MGGDPVDYGGRTRAVRPLDAIELIEAEYPAHGRIEEHRHGAWTLTFVLDGMFKERLGTAIERCGTADVLLRPAGLSHADWGGPVPSICLTVSVSRQGHLPGAPAARGRLSSDHLARCARMLALAARTPGASTAQLEGLVAELLKRTEAVRTAVRPTKLARTAASVLDATGGRRLCDLAQTLGVHRSHLARDFRRVHGCTVGDYARMLRLERSVRMLDEATPGCSLASVASEAGFCDQSHFIRAFRQELGCTPSAYLAAGQVSVGATVAPAEGQLEI